MIGSVITSSLSQAEHDYAWSGSIEVTNPASFGRIQINDPIDLELGTEVYKLIVDNKTLERNGVGMPRLSVSLISPTVRFTTPRAVPFDRVWDTSVWARDAAESAIGEAIQWELLNWTIYGGRLAVHQASPLDVVKVIASAAGGLVETLPNGTLRVRHRFPVAVPDWNTHAADHILTDTSDNLSCRESHILRTRVNKVLVRGYLPTDTDGFLAVEVDSRPDGPNHGKTQFYKGDTVYLLAYAGPNVTLASPVASNGTLTPGAWQSVEITQDLVFSGNATATLDKPATSIDSVIWLGRNLGSLTLEADNRTVSVSTPGVAITQIKYRAFAQSWSFSAPAPVAWMDEYSVQVHFSGTISGRVGIGEVFCQRGDGAFRGEDVSDPLLSTDDAKRSRGRAEIDAGESLQEVSITCLHRAGFMPGQLVEVHDSLMGRYWRGKITSVSHSAQGKRLTTSLGVLRRVQPTF